MRFAILGPTQVWDGDRQVELGPSRRRLVLAALIIDVGRVVPTPVLLDRVWDGEPPESATATLHSYVSRLRAALADATASPPAIVTTSPRGYALDVTPNDVDHWQFTDLLDRARRRAGDGDPVAARGLLDTALTLWRGTAYADYGVEFALAESRRLHDLRLSGFELAAELDLELGRHATIAAPLSVLVSDEPFREPLRAALMLALYRSGRQAEALQAYEDGRRVLADELGADPDPKLQRLHAQILRQDPQLDLPSPTPVTVTSTVVASADRFIGREIELARAAEAIGSGRFLAVVGEAGIGKSRMVEELATQAKSRIVAWGRSWQHEGAPALWPWIQVIRDIAAQTPPDQLRGAIAGRASVLASLVPELNAEMSTAVPVSVEQAEVMLFDAVTAFMEAISVGRELLLVIDDLQWADPASNQMLEYAATHLKTNRVAVVVTIRSPTDEAAHPDLDVLATLARHPNVTRLDVPALTPDEVRDYVADRSAGQLDEVTALALHARTGGNPFYVGEIVRLVVASGRQKAITEGVPDSVRGVIRRRVRELDDVDQQVLRTAALIGRTFDIDLIAEVSGVTPDEVDEAVDRATSFGLLGSEPGTSDQHRFTHALLQETLLDETGPTRQRRVHRLIADALLARRERRGAATTSAERVAHHYAAAGSDADLVQSVEQYLTASDEADSRASYPEVQRLLRTALEVAERIASTEGDALRSTVRYRLGSFSLLFDGPYALDARQAQLGQPATADHEAPVRELLTSFHTDWGNHHSRNQLDESEVVANALALVAEQRDDNLLRVGALTTRGYDDLQRGRFSEAAASFAAIEPMLSDLVVPQLLFTANPVVAAPLWAGIAETIMGNIERSDEMMARALARARSLPDPLTRSFAEGGDLLRWVWRGDVERARVAAEQCVATTDSDSFGMMVSYMSMPLAWELTQRDREAGLAAAESAMAVLDAPDGMVWRPFLSGLFADVLVQAGQPARAVERVDAALTESARTGAAIYDAELHRIKALALQALRMESAQIAAEIELARNVAVRQGAGLFLARLQESFPGD